MTILRLHTFNLADTLTVCRRLSRTEQEVCEAFTGTPYDADDVAAAARFYNGIHFVAHDGVEPIAVGGFIRQRPGVFRTWFYAPDNVWAPYAGDLTALVARVIQDTLASKLAHRIETVTLADRSQARAWYARLGLEFESTLRGYGTHGEDAVMYVALSNPEKV